MHAGLCSSMVLTPSHHELVVVRHDAACGPSWPDEIMNRIGGFLLLVSGVGPGSTLATNDDPESTCSDHDSRRTSRGRGRTCSRARAQDAILFYRIGAPNQLGPAAVAASRPPPGSGRGAATAAGRGPPAHALILREAPSARCFSAVTRACSCAVRSRIEAARSTKSAYRLPSGVGGEETLRSFQ